MAWIDPLEGRLVGVDTSPFIYFIERTPRYIDAVRAFFRAVDEGRVAAVTSSATLLEVLVQPLRQGDAALALAYRETLLDGRGLSVRDLTVSVAEEAARLRAGYNVGFADAIQLATALLERASLFLTNDRRLARVAELRVLVLDDLLAGSPQEGTTQ